MDVCDACYIFCNYYKSLKKKRYGKSNNFIDDDDDDDDDDAVDGYGNDTNIITDIELKAQNTKYTKSNRQVPSLYLKTIQADYLKEKWKNQIIYTKAQL